MSSRCLVTNRKVTHAECHRLNDAFMVLVMFRLLHCEHYTLNIVLLAIRSLFVSYYDMQQIVNWNDPPQILKHTNDLLRDAGQRGRKKRAR